jgi:hypothetical protein
MPDEKDYNQIKAGVDGVLDNIPAPSEADVPAAPEMAETHYEEQPAPTEPTVDYSNYNSSQTQSPQGASVDMNKMHEIIEAVISEKWEEAMGQVGNIAVWKEKVSNDVISLKQELIRTQERFDNLQNAILGRIKDYDSGIKDVHTEMKALERVFEKILEPLTSNIKELNTLTQDLKKLKK